MARSCHACISKMNCMVFSMPMLVSIARSVTTPNVQRPPAGWALRARARIQQEGRLRRLAEVETIGHVVRRGVTGGERTKPETRFHKFQERREFVLSVRDIP